MNAPAACHSVHCVTHLSRAHASPARGESRTDAVTVRAANGWSGHEWAMRAGKPIAPRLGIQTEWSGQPQTLLVLDAATRDGRDWVKLLLPARPNGATGWVLRDRVALSHIRYWIEVRTGARRVSVYRDGRLVRRFSAVVGKPSTPTPHGLAAIYELNRQPNPRDFLGPWSLPLTVHSTVLQSFGGGPGRVAIHGRAGASLLDPLGSARSHGCIRVLNRDISWMAADIARGTPVRLRG